jgi:hypothetical protein
MPGDFPQRREPGVRSDRVGSLTFVESVNNHQLGVKADTAMRLKQMAVMRFAKRPKLTRAKSPLKTRL